MLTLKVLSVNRVSGSSLNPEYTTISTLSETLS